MLAQSIRKKTITEFKQKGHEIFRIMIKNVKRMISGHLCDVFSFKSWWRTI